MRLEGVIRVGKRREAEGSIVGKSGRGTEDRHESRGGTETERSATCGRHTRAVSSTLIVIKGTQSSSLKTYG